VYVDECGIDEYLTREYGRAKIGALVPLTKKGRKFQRINIIGGVCNGKHIGIKCYKNSTTGTFFEDWFESDLIPNLPKNSVVVMDNASFHRKRQLNEIADKYGVFLLFLPPYSPDYNPIEKSWANMKRWLRSNLPFFVTPASAVYEYFDLL
jgi:transposase